MAEYSVELRGVSKIYPAWHGSEVAAVREMELRIGSGEFFTFLGPSGCGKTTTLRLIAGFETATQGQIFIQGKNVTQTPPNRRPVNTVFQSYALFPHLSVEQNVAYGLVVQRVPANERKRRSQEALEMVRLSGMGDRKPSQLSGGQQQRVALARALVNRPAVLLLDEPLGALDLKLRKEMQFELKQLQTQVGITFVYVTHDQEEALTMSDRIAVMSEGRVLQVDEPLAIYEKPASRFVADFIGETNFLRGRVEEVENGLIRLRVAGELLAVWRGEAQISPLQAVSLAIRPEKFSLVAINGSNGHRVCQKNNGEICLNGVVQTAVYLGTDTRYAVQLGNGENIIVRIRNAGEHGLGEFTSGERVQVWCKPEDARVLIE